MAGADVDQGKSITHATHKIVADRVIAPTESVEERIATSSPIEALIGSSTRQQLVLDVVGPPDGSVLELHAIDSVAGKMPDGLVQPD